MAEISLLAAGDCGPVHGPEDGFPLKRYTELVRPVLAMAEVRFVNCMRTYSERGSPSERAPRRSVESGNRSLPEQDRRERAAVPIRYGSRGHVAGTVCGNNEIGNGEVGQGGQGRRHT